MRRRFSRGRNSKNPGGASAPPIDAARVFAGIVDGGLVSAPSLTPAADEEIPPGLAAVGTGEGESGPVVVGFAPRHGGDAAFAAISHALKLGGEEPFQGEVVAVAPQWTIPARRRLGLIGDLPFAFRAVLAPELGEGPEVVLDDRDAGPAPSPQQLASAAGDAPTRALFGKALAAFEGLAAKHGGAVRGARGGVELVLLARCVAVLEPADDAVVLTTTPPDRWSTPLASDDLAATMDRLEGSLRKRLSDRRARGGEEGTRAQLIGPLAEAAGLREFRPWPLAGCDSEILDLLGVTEEGAPAVAAIRARLDLAGLGAIVDAALSLRPAIPGLLTAPDAPTRVAELRLLLAAREFDAAVVRLLPNLALAHATWDVVARRGQAPSLELRGADAGATRRAEPETVGERAEEADRQRRGRSRRRRGGRRSAAAAEAEVTAEEQPAPAEETGAPPEEAGEALAFDEVSVFDLDDVEPATGDGGSRRRRRGRGRRRGRRGGATAGGDEAPAIQEAPGAEPDEGAVEPAAEGRSRRERRRGGRSRAQGEEALTTDDEVDLPETLAPLADVAEIEPVVEELAYEDEEDAEEVSPEEERVQREREARTRARMAKTQPVPEAVPPRPRRRKAAIVAHGDRGSVLAAVLLARDVRLIEGFWVYPQSELMTFFRSVTTDLHEATPIYLVGFTASPARDTLQTAALYAGRLEWFDHHDWPPEDLERLSETIGAENVHVQPGAGSSLPAVLEGRTRRSRFSDKLVELATGRFSLHDYERWGRLWWHRLGAVAERSGPRRADVDPLLSGRPSDLAREAARAEKPPEPAEVDYVSRRDFKLVHFGGYALVVVPTPVGLDPLLASRVARERFSAQVSVANVEGTELVLLASEDSQGRRGLDLGSMVDHLASKHEWIEALPDDDHVARLRVRNLVAAPERLDEVVGEIAMGRSILEG